MMWVDMAIFGFLLFSPCLALIPKMDKKWVVVLLWVVIGLIMWCKIEYSHRAAVWYICLNRGIILDFQNTHELKGLMLQIPMLLAAVFIVSVGIVIYVGLDPEFKFSNTDYIISAVLAIVGVLFVFSMTKGFVDLEGAPTLSVNMLTFFFDDENILEKKGYKVVKLADLQTWMENKKSEKDSDFSWNEVHAIGSAGLRPKGLSLIGGFKLFYFLKPHKDTDK